jgi:hypothetical protein
MNFFVVGDKGGAPRVELSRDAWLYVATALPLTILTVGAWAAWDRFNMKK